MRFDTDDSGRSAVWPRDVGGRGLRTGGVERTGKSKTASFGQVCGRRRGGRRVCISGGNGGSEEGNFIGVSRVRAGRRLSIVSPVRATSGERREISSALSTRRRVRTTITRNNNIQPFGPPPPYEV